MRRYIHKETFRLVEGVDRDAAARRLAARDWRRIAQYYETRPMADYIRERCRFIESRRKLIANELVDFPSNPQ